MFHTLYRDFYLIVTVDRILLKREYKKCPINILCWNEFSGREGYGRFRTRSIGVLLLTQPPTIGVTVVLGVAVNNTYRIR